MFKVSPVDAGDVDDHVDHVAAQLVRLHVHRAAVCGDGDLTDHVEQEGLLDARVLGRPEAALNPLSSPKAHGCAPLRTYWLLFLGWTKHALPSSTTIEIECFSLASY